MKALFEKVAGLVAGRRPRWRTSTVIIVVGALIAAALSVDGYRTTKFDLDEASVWATNAREAKAGRVNTQIGQIEVLSQPISAALDVYQSGRDVALIDPGKSVSLIDAATGNPAGQLALLEGTEVYSSGSSYALFDRAGGRLFSAAYPALPGVDFEDDDAAVEVPADAAIAVASNGAVAVASAEKARLEVVGGADEDNSFELAVEPGDLQVNLIGSVPVALDRQGLLQVGATTVDLSEHGSAFALQGNSTATGRVVVATDSSLLGVDVASGEVSELVGGLDGVPAAPVLVNGCAHGAWSVDGGVAVRYDLHCSGGETSSTRVEHPAGQLRFRSNGVYTMLNFLDDGYMVFARDGKFVSVENWEDPNPQDQSQEQEDDTEDGAGDDECASGAENSPPEPQPDNGLGARPMVATVLNLVANDRDADCDVLTVRSIENIVPSGAAEIFPIARGRSVQFTSAAGFTGQVSFDYFVTDGRSEAVKSSATVVVKAFETENEAPVQVDTPPQIEVSVGQTVSFNVLDSFIDPDGDALILDGAVLPLEVQGTVRAQPDGLVTYSDSGAQSDFEISLNVSDGRSLGSGVLKVKMVSDAEPIARNDHAVGLVDRMVAIKVLENDSGVGGDALMLAGVGEAPANSTVSADTSAGLLLFSASAAGSYRLSYAIASGGKSAEGWVRIDIEAPTENVPPVAVRDIVTVAVGATATVDLLANDSDRNLDVLVVQSVTSDPSSGVTAQLLEHRAARVSATRQSPEPVVLDYVVTDGVNDPVHGQLVVQVVTRSELNRPPVAKDDVAYVRVGEVVSVAALDNDLDPDGDTLELTGMVEINAVGDTPPGLAFVSGNAVRFLAGASPTSVSVTYEVTDGLGGISSALVRLTILAAEGNNAPIPRNLETRTVAGAPVTVNVPVHGIDPDGDSVALTLKRQATSGVAELGEGCDCFVYTPAAGATGSDSFTYVATDTFGAQGEATIRVGVAQRSALNSPPIATDDVVRVQPGGRFNVPVLSNDSDPDGDQITLEELSTDDHNGVTGTIDGDRVVVEAGDATTATLSYVISDGRENSTGYITVEVSTDAPPVPPIARDDVAVRADASATSIEVPVLDNDEDPDGVIDQVTVDLSDLPAGTATTNGTTVTVTLDARPSVVPYRVTDPQGLTAFAVIRVPAAAENLPPRLRSGIAPVKVDGGATVNLSIADYIEDPEGETVNLVPGDGVTATQGTAAAVDAGTVAFTAAAEYNGPGAISVVVTDSADPADPLGARATLTIPVEIASEINISPVFAGASATVEVAGDPTTVDLLSYVEDPGDEANLRFSDLSAAADGVTASLEGTSIKLTADASAKVGTTQQLLVTVSDGENPPVQGPVTVSVVASRKPLAKANTDVVEATSGNPSVIDVLANDQAPPGLEPLTVESLAVDNSYGSATTDGSKVTFTPTKEFVGVGEFTYVVHDKTDDPSRAVTGTIRISVKDKPATPQPPMITDSGNQFVVVTWETPDRRAGTISQYELSSVDGSFTKNCGVTTTCRLEGLTNGKSYQFRVRAENEIGWSEPSVASETIIPDTRPGTPPVAPTLTYKTGMAGGTLEVSWPAAGSSGWINEGTPIETYQLELNPPPSNTAQLSVSGATTSLVITGLTDGIEYTARVRAKNSAVLQNDGWSDWSPLGNRESPASVSAAPGGVRATRVDDPVASVIRVEWARPTAINSKELTGYIVLVNRNGAISRVPYPGSAAAATFQQDISADTGATYSFQVVAVNKAGESTPSAATAAQVGFKRPDKIASVTATATGVNNQIKLTFAQPASNGDAIDGYMVQLRGGASFLPYVGDGILLTTISNGVDLWFAVQACNQGTNEAYCGEPTQSNTTSAYGPPGAPSVSAAHVGGNTIRLSWSPPASNGRPIDGMQISVNGGGWQDVGLSGSQDHNGGYSATYSIRARAKSSGTIGAESNTASATAPPPPPPPPPTISLSRGAGASAGYWYSVTLTNFPANTAVPVSCNDGVDRDFWPPATITTNGAGTGIQTKLCYSGDPGPYTVTSGQYTSNAIDSW